MDIEELRVAVFRSFALTGRVPDLVELAGALDLEPDSVAAGLRQLAQGRHLVLDDQDRVVMAHPFSAVPLGFAVMGAQTLWWGGCGWDSFALPHLLGEDDVLVVDALPGMRQASRVEHWS